MQNTVVPQKAEKIPSIFALRTKLLWQKMTGKKESIIKDTRSQLADAYSARGVERKNSSGGLREELLSNLDPVSPTGLVWGCEQSEVTIGVALMKFTTWRAAVLFSKSAHQYTATQKFSEAAAAWEETAGCRMTLASLCNVRWAAHAEEVIRYGYAGVPFTFGRFYAVTVGKFASDYIENKAGRAWRNASNAYRLGGDAEKAEYILSLCD